MLRLVLVGLCSGWSTANAGQMTFDLTWSGASFGNSATAVGQITFDPTLVTYPGTIYTDNGTWAGVTDFTMTVTGASSGNGTFDFSDFSYFWFNTGGLSLDFTKELFGQPTVYPDAPWGTIDPVDMYGGEFNLWTPEGSNAPIGYWFFTIQTDRYAGDLLALTSFAPAVPEPSSFALAGIGVCAWATHAFRRRLRASTRNHAPQTA